MAYTADVVKGWDVARVVEWAKSLGLDDEDAAILFANKITGKRLLNLTEDKLRADGMARGPASDLAVAIDKIRGPREYGPKVASPNAPPPSA